MDYLHFENLFYIIPTLFTAGVCYLFFMACMINAKKGRTYNLVKLMYMLLGAEVVMLAVFFWVKYYGLELGTLEWIGIIFIVSAVLRFAFKALGGGWQPSWQRTLIKLLLGRGGLNDYLHEISWTYRHGYKVPSGRESPFYYPDRRRRWLFNRGFNQATSEGEWLPCNVCKEKVTKLTEVVNSEGKTGLFVCDICLTDF